MNSYLVITSIVIIIETLLALIVYLHNSHEKSNRIFGLFIGSVILWTLSNLLIISIHSLFWTRMAYVVAVLGIYILVFFVEVFPSVSLIIGGVKRVILHTITVGVVVLTLLPAGWVVADIDVSVPGVGVITGPLFPVVAIYLIILFFLAVFVLTRKLIRSSGTEKVQLQYMSFGFLVSIALGLIANLILPLLTGDYTYTEYGPYGFVVFIVLTVFAIVRYNLMNITVIATEVFAALLILILLGQVFVAEGPLQIMVSFTVLTLATVLSYFLIRSMLREVRQKEELALLTTQLEQVNEQLKRLDETKSEFVSIASHQLRTPLTVIKGYISMILEGSFGSVPDKHRQPLEKVYESGERLISLVENLLSVSRIESGRMKYTMAFTQLADLAAKVVDELSTAAKKKQLALKFSMPQKLPPLINLDEEKIRQVMTNLVDNSIKYTKRGTVAVSVRHEPNGVDGHFQKPCVVFSVSDTGNGVRAEDKDRLFQNVIRRQGSALVHTEGTGLGLYVGRMMVEAHGGAIWVESKGEGLGSTFAFAIPLPPPPKDKSVIALEEMLG